MASQAHNRTGFSTKDKIGEPSIASDRRARSEEPMGVNAGRNTRTVYSLALALPLFYNADADGKRRAVEAEKLAQTEAEIKSRFDGFTCLGARGWCRGEPPDAGCTDENLLYSIDAPMEQVDIDDLQEWKCQLEERFEQEMIYMTVSGPTLQL